MKYRKLINVFNEEKIFGVSHDNEVASKPPQLTYITEIEERNPEVSTGCTATDKVCYRSISLINMVPFLISAFHKMTFYTSNAKFFFKLGLSRSEGAPQNKRSI